MAAWTLLTLGSASLLLAPLSSVVLSWGLLRGGVDVVGNEELMSWGLSWRGIIWTILAGGFGLTTTIVQFAGIFHIITDDLEGRGTGTRQTALDLLPRLSHLFRLCLVAVAIGILLAAPIIGGFAIIRTLVLGTYDLNYYLIERPREWQLAIILATGWAFVVGLPILHFAARSVLAVPAYLDGHSPLLAALKESWRRTRGGATHLVRALVLSVMTWLVLRALIVSIYFAASSGAISWLSSVSTSLRTLVLATSAHAAGAVILDTVISFVGFAFVATVVTKVYHENTDLHALALPARQLGKLPSRTSVMFRQTVRPSRLVGIGLFLAAGSILLSGYLIDQVPDLRPVTVVAHRAGPAPAPENTLAALERSIHAGAHVVEVDVQRTLDGVIVVIHDADLMRMARDPRRIRQTPYRDLTQVVQNPDDGSPTRERRVARLAEFLARAKDRIQLMIELKYYGPDPGLAEAVVREVREFGMTRQSRIMSLDYNAVREVMNLAPDIKVGYVAAAAVGDLSRLPVDFLALSQSRLSSQLVREARRRGMEIYAWTVNRPDQMIDLIERGVDGLITDNPVLAVRINAEVVELSPAGRLMLRFRDLWDEEPVATYE